MADGESANINNYHKHEYISGKKQGLSQEKTKLLFCCYLRDKCNLKFRKDGDGDMELIQTIRLFRKKKDDIWSLYIIEFFKFIGCIVTDYVFPDTYRAEVDICGEYDAEILLDLDEANVESDEEQQFWKKLLTEILKKKRVAQLQIFQEPSNELILHKDSSCVLLENLINQIWDDSDVSKELRYLGYVYAKSNIFYYLYNEGNLKFVQEYYPIKGEKAGSNSLKESYRQSYNRFGACYNLMNDYKTNPNVAISVYYDYALLLMRYKLNEMAQLLINNKVFQNDGLLQIVEQIVKKEPEFARVNFLAGSICKSDIKYRNKTEEYYNKVITLLKKKNFPESEIYFIYYQIGRFWEKKMKEEKLAYKAYQMAYESSKAAYRAQYKVIQKCARNENWDEVIRHTHETIKYLINGYEISDIMPKQKIYAYKCFVILGDTYYITKRYDLALLCYERAVDIAKVESSFYTVFKENLTKCFEDNFRSCTPLRPLYFKMISCASKENNKQLIDRYYDELYFTEAQLGG